MSQVLGFYFYFFQGWGSNFRTGGSSLRLDRKMTFFFPSGILHDCVGVSRQSASKIRIAQTSKPTCRAEDHLIELVTDYVTSADHLADAEQADGFDTIDS